jgi:hypothetical protein
MRNELDGSRRHLADGGLFVFDVNTFEGLRDGWRGAAVKREEIGRAHV